MIRSATPTDAAAIQAIYAPFVQHTAISFEEHPPSVADMEQRIAYALREQQFIVHEEGAQFKDTPIPAPTARAPHIEHRSMSAYTWLLPRIGRGLGERYIPSCCMALSGKGIMPHSQESRCPIMQAWACMRRWGLP